MTLSRSIAVPRSASRRGIALVITLLMLSVVTITAVTFLAVSRRERASVGTFAEQIDARFLAEAGLRHAQGRLSSRMAAVTNRMAYGGFMVSTNYINPYFRFGQSFLDTRNFRALTNVSYYRTNGTLLFDINTDAGRQAYAKMLGNLYYDPRPPVFVQTNRNPQSPLDFRFYLDLNRNGQFETNGLLWARDRNGRTNGLGLEWMWGDPEWIGLLQNPDVPHSGTNHFVGRFAYVVVPASRALDLNFMGNEAKRLPDNVGSALPNPQANPPLLESGFLRNQGVGSWEVNPAGFLAALNTNIWLNQVEDYYYKTNFNQGSTGIAFSDAERLRRFRQEAYTPPSAERFFAEDSGRPDDARINDVFRRDFVDGYSDGPLSLTVRDLRGRLDDDDRANLEWSGANLTNHFTEINDLFQPRLGMVNRITGQYTNSANVRQTSPLSTYDRYTFYRLASQLGTDSSDGRVESGFHPAYSDLQEALGSRRPAVNPYGYYRRAKLNLNYGPDVLGDTRLEAARISSFRTWEPVEWFTNAAHRLLLSEFTNGLPFRPPGLATNSPGLAVYGSVVVATNNQTYRTNYSYDARVHRSLQVAANIYDGANSRVVGTTANRVALPSVFRPIFYEDVQTPGVLRLHSYQEILGGTPEFLSRLNWITPEQAVNRLNAGLPENAPTSQGAFNVFGMPWVVGAKKGLPNFNQAHWQTVIQPTRRLIIRRPTRTSEIGPTELPFTAGGNSGRFQTYFQYLITMTNMVGVEAWNSYAQSFNRDVRIYATNIMDVALWDESEAGDFRRLVQRRELLSINQEVKAGTWGARQYVAPLFRRNTTAGQFQQFPANLPGQVLTNLSGGIAFSTGFIYDAENRQAVPMSVTNVGWVPVATSRVQYLTPSISAYITNNLVFAITDQTSGRLLDIVTLQSVVTRTNILSVLSKNTAIPGQGGLVEGANGVSDYPDMSRFWNTNLVENNRTLGMDNQMLASLGQFDVPESLWRNPLGVAGGAIEDRQIAVDGLQFFVYGIDPTGRPNEAAIRRQFGSNLVAQVGFNPSPTIHLSDRRMANDPLVHYTMEDLSPGYLLRTESGYGEILNDLGGPGQAPTLFVSTDPSVVEFNVGRRGKLVNAYAPWGTNANLTGAQRGSSQRSQSGAGSTGGSAFNYAFKDPQIRSSDNWEFPVGTNTQFRYGSVGQLGRIHRGTPWQTLYLKSEVPAVEGLNDSLMSARYVNANQPTWGAWSGNRFTSPPQDWKILDLFTTAYNENAARGQMGVNQTNIAAWTALLSAVPVLRTVDPAPADDPRPAFLEPGSEEIRQILEGYNLAGGQHVPGLLDKLQEATNGILSNPNGVFPSLGSILQVPTLSDRAPFLRSDLNWSTLRNVSDEVLERLPQQILSLLRADEPRFVIYSYGQTLKPAPNAVSLRPGPLYGMTTNYTITGEFVTKTVLRLDGDPRRLQPVTEDQRVILSNP